MLIIPLEYFSTKTNQICLIHASIPTILHAFDSTIDYFNKSISHYYVLFIFIAIDNRAPPQSRLGVGVGPSLSLVDPFHTHTLLSKSNLFWRRISVSFALTWTPDITTTASGANLVGVMLPHIRASEKNHVVSVNFYSAVRNNLSIFLKRPL